MVTLSNVQQLLDRAVAVLAISDEDLIEEEEKELGLVNIWDLLYDNVAIDDRLREMVRRELRMTMVRMMGLPPDVLR